MSLNTGYDKPFLFGECDYKSCVNLSVINDELLEETESYQVTLSMKKTSILDSRITLFPMTAEVNIIDDDGICPFQYHNTHNSALFS